MSANQVPPEMIKKYYALLVASLLNQTAMTGQSLSEVVAKTVSLFGLVPVKDQPDKYEFHPEFRTKVDEATGSEGLSNLPKIFSEDDALVFCACTTATLQMHGELDNFTSRIQQEIAKLEEEMSAKGLLKHDPVGIPKESNSNILPISKRKTKTDDDGGPTFH